MAEIIGAQHNFHDQEYAAGWVDRFVPTPSRLALFDLILTELESRIPGNGCIVELGIGPGYLADHVLKAMADIRYYGVDFSAAMLDIAQARLRPYSSRVAFVQAELVNDRWWETLPTPVHSIISTWALHDLGSQEATEVVYRNCARILPEDGLLLNGDFIKPDGTSYDYEPGRFEIAKQLEILNRAGFDDSCCLATFEAEIDSPTAAQNYACFRGIR